jgi:dTDP-4-dehydrorhamnose 3,5-epimerase
MQIQATRLLGVLLLEPHLLQDGRGMFYESFNARRFLELTGIRAQFVQDNHSHSHRGVVRGLHYQIRHTQGKLVRVTRGAALDIMVDLRRSSPTFGQWQAIELNQDNYLQLWIPPGFAHGFHALADNTELLYKTTQYWMPEHERHIRWDDPDLAIDWQLAAPPLLSAKDAQGTPFRLAEVFP